MKTNPSTRDLLLQLWLHTKVFKGRFCSAFSQQPRAATAACWGKAGSFSQTPLSPTSSDPWNSGLLHIFISLLPHIIQEPLAAGLCFQTPVGTEFHSYRCHHTTPQAPTRLSLRRLTAGRCWVWWILPHCCCLKAKFWSQERSLGLGQDEERHEHPARCFTSSVHRPAAEKTAQTKCLKVSQLKLLKLILGFIYIYITLWVLLIDINNKQTCGTPRLKTQRPNPPSLAEGRGSINLSSIFHHIFVKHNMAQSKAHAHEVQH